jgi:serine/threonine protein kinase
MSPERLKKETYSFSSDIWSLGTNIDYSQAQSCKNLIGVVLWELASGEVPWCGSTNVAVLQSMQDYPLTRASSPLKSGS